LRLEHFPESVDYRLGKLAEALAAFGKASQLGADEARAVWRDIRDCAPLAEPRGRAVWKISVAPGWGADVAADIARTVDARWFYDWSGGLIWMSAPAEGDCGAASIWGAVAAVGGHATLMRAPDALRENANVFQPLAAPLMKLTRGLKAAFDPDGVLNPGRMYAGV